MTRVQVGTSAFSRPISTRLPLRTLPLVFLFVVLVGILLFSGLSPVLAQEPSPISVRVEVGFDGKARAGHWTPVVVQMENQGPDFAGEVQIFGTPGQSARYVTDIVLPTNSRKLITLHVPHLATAPRLGVELVSDGKVVASLEPRVSLLRDSDLFVGVVGQRVGAWNLLTTMEMPGPSGEVVVAAISPDRFPRRPDALGAFDVIALGDVQVQTLSPGMLEALEGWVAGGGTLILPAGPNARVNLQGLPDQLMPVQIGDAVELVDNSALERLGREPFPAAFPLTVSGSKLVSGRVLAQEGDVPLAVLSRFGRGGVLFLAFDPAAQPLAGWVGMPQVWKELLYPSLPPFVALSTRESRRDHWGPFSRWAPRSQQALSNLAALEFPSINLLLGLIGGYILLVGPVNYVVLRRLRRPGLTWVTIPALVLLFSGSAYFLAVEAKGSDVQGRTVSIIQGVHDTDWARVRRMVRVVAPSQADYRVEVSGNALVASWDGGLRRSMSSPGGAGDTPVRIRNGEDGSELELLNMGMWTMRSLWTDGVQRVEEALSHDLYIEGDRLKGTVTNKSPVPLKQVWVIAGGLGHDLGTLGPRDTAIVDISLAASPLGRLGRSSWRQQPHYPAGLPPSDPKKQRLQQLLVVVGTAALESYYNGPSLGLSLPIVAWTDEIPMGITVNEEKLAGPSLTFFVKPVTPRVQGSFSLPSGLLMGRVVNFEGQVAETTPEKVVLSEGSTITFQFEVPTNIQDTMHMSLRVPFIGDPSTGQGAEALAYHWEEDTWDPLDLRPVSLKIPSSSPPRTPSRYRPPHPALGPGGAIFYPIPHVMTFNQELEGEFADARGLSSYVSTSGIVRIKLTMREVHVGVPSLALQGVARE